MTRAKEVENLDCDADVLTGARQVLQTRLIEVCEFREAALDWSDIEGVHDMRVATRRLRSALRDFKPYLKQTNNYHKLKDFNAQIKTLADALGAVRDLDVQIESLEKLPTQVTKAAEAREGIEHLIDERKIERETKRHTLVETLNKIDLEKLPEMLADALKDVKNNKDKTDAYRTSAREIISNSYQAFVKLSGALTRPRAANRLHRLRIAAKRLRYALELFAPCFKTDTKDFAKQIAEIQKSLGKLHDCDVWLDELAKRMKRKKYRAGENEQHAAREAIIRLLIHFNSERTRAFHDSLMCWKEWEHQNFDSNLLESCGIENSSKIDISNEAGESKAVGLKEETLTLDVITNEIT